MANDPHQVARAFMDQVLTEIGRRGGKHRPIAHASGFTESGFSRCLSLRNGALPFSPSVKTICRVADGLGMRVVITLEPKEKT